MDETTWCELVIVCDKQISLNDVKIPVQSNFLYFLFISVFIIKIESLIFHFNHIIRHLLMGYYFHIFLSTIYPNWIGTDAIPL